MNIDEYRKEKGSVSFTKSVSRTFHEESWQETKADEGAIQAYAEWYFKQMQPGNQE